MDGRVALVVAVAACRADFHVDPAGTDNAPPFASAGAGSTYLVGSTVTLDGSRSFDLDGQIVRYQWFVTPPSGNPAALAEAAQTTAVLDMPGVYAFELLVTDDRGAVSTSTVDMTSAPPAISVNAGANADVAWRHTVQLAGSLHVEAGIPATFAWSFVSRPPRSTAVLASTDTLTPSFVADAEGEYVVALAVTTQYNTASATVTVTSHAARQILNYTVVDAEYSSALNKFAIVSASPPALHVYDPATGTDSMVPLSWAPTSISIDPTGAFAAIGHTLRVTIVRLQPLAVVRTVAVQTDIYDVAYDANNRIHCIPTSAAITPVYTIEASGAVTAVASSMACVNAHARVAPGGRAMYLGWCATNGAHYDLTTDPITLGWYSPRNFGTDLWFIHNGTEILGNDGQVLTSTSDVSTDLDVVTTLALADGTRPGFDWAHEAAGMLAAISTPTPVNDPYVVLTIYDAQTLAVRASQIIPDTPFNGTTYQNVGKLVAIRSDGSKIYVLTKAAVSAVYPLDP